jgi:hypothetical protein
MDWLDKLIGLNMPAFLERVPRLLRAAVELPVREVAYNIAAHVAIETSIVWALAILVYTLLKPHKETPCATPRN